MSEAGLQGQILLVISGETGGHALASRLEEWGFTVTTAVSGQDAAGVVEGRSVDLVLLDVGTQAADAFEVLDELRRRFPPAALPIVVCTAEDRLHESVESLHRGANDCVAVDLPPELLRVRLQTHVALQRATEELQASTAALSRLQRKLDYDLQAAARIQQSQMPADDLSIDGWEVAWHSSPCETLGGDSLNVIRLDDENWALYVLDVSGHGVPASLLAVSVSRILTPGRDGSGRHDTLLPPRPLADRRGIFESASVASAVYVLERLQEKFVPEEDAVQFFTILYVTLNSRTGEVRIASGGHPAPLLMRSGQPPVLFSEPDGPAIGLIPLWADVPFHEGELTLQPGDTLLLYSDGVIEAFNPEQELFGAERLQRSLSAHADAPLRQTMQGVHTDIEVWRAGQPQKDDETMLALRRVD